MRCHWLLATVGALRRPVPCSPPPLSASTQLGIALGTALTPVVFFLHAPAGSHGTIGYVVGAFVLMWALMFLLPKRTNA